MMFTLKAIIALIPAKEKICAVYASIAPAAIKAAGSAVAMIPTANNIIVFLTFFVIIKP
jgi:hypothetical protein